MKNIPDKIYLNLGIDCEPVFEDENVDFKELSEVTWSQDKIGCNDIEYVRKEVTDWEARRYELVKICLKSILSDPECEITPDELADICITVANAIITEMKETKV